MREEAVQLKSIEMRQQFKDEIFPNILIEADDNHIQ